ncbi:hypothetical protein SZN_34202 [Streptomyces zinciresistens K42]|uniref:Regulator of SigK n=1 Tax=Streptomyces zinciresistens K42 TaxID=700597 RepID=G2GMT5_9ACTN|nr:anti-sigma factor [Streptomyces zinciresistens]EGX55173.1 hypothetical protein SZN_34202 [Streptomyces zinciresistens K42]
MITDDLHRMAGAYALHALPDDEREAFERHLAGCAPCAQESAELAATAARLGLAAAAAPRREMREQVLRRIGTVRQESPGTADTARAGRGTARGAVLGRWALAACLAGATALGGTAWWQYDRAQEAVRREAAAERQSAEIAAVLSAPDATTRAGRLPDGARGSVVVSRARDRAVFVVSGLPRPPGGKTYQLWFDDGGTMRSAGLLDPGRGARAVLMQGAVGRSSGMGVTVEPAGGSARPTTAPLALMEFA